MSTDNDTTAASAEQRARRRLAAEKGFYVHLTTYAVVIGALFLINALTNRAYWWFVWPAIGWGIGILFHAFSVFGSFGARSREWEDRRLKQLIDEENRRG
ncbi:MAG: 2TM domain-containing protein [Burkholderiaceae bacterium]